MNAFRELLSTGRVTHVPGVYDPLSTTLAVHAGHRAVLLSKAAVAAVMMGRPDVAFVQATQIADRAATLRPVLEGVPLLADAAIGFDGPQDTVWTALAYERAGIAGVVLADPTVEMIQALVEQVPQLAVIARTTAYATGGLEAVIARGEQYAAAGADAVLPAGVHSAGELARVTPGVPLVVSRSEADPAAPTLTDAELAGLGVRLVLHPLAALLAAARAASLTYRAIAEEGGADTVDRMPWAAFATLAAPSPDAAFVPANLQT